MYIRIIKRTFSGMFALPVIVMFCHLQYYNTVNMWMYMNYIPEPKFSNKIEFRNQFQELIPNFGIISSWNWFLLEQGIPSSSRNRIGNRVRPLNDEKSMPCLKINILWSIGNPILRINSNIQICLKIHPRSFYPQVKEYS